MAKRTVSIGYDVSITQHGFNNFSVKYGLQSKTELTYSGAAKEIGACIMHSLAIDREIDNRSRAEARIEGDSMPVYSAARIFDTPGISIGGRDAREIDEAFQTLPLSIIRHAKTEKMLADQGVLADYLSSWMSEDDAEDVAKWLIYLNQNIPALAGNY